MKYLSTQQLAAITITGRASVCFVVPVAVAAVIVFIASSLTAKTVICSGWQLAEALVIYLAGWRDDLALMWQALTVWEVGYVQTA